MAYRPDVSDPTLWIFGYGSLIWRPDFEHARSVPGRIHGWTRRFWQGSTDHRGLPGRPGRVVTLLPADDPDVLTESKGRAGVPCWGRAFEVAGRDRDRVLAQLDHRERGGYERIDVTIELAGQHAPQRAGKADSGSAGSDPASPASQRPGLLYVATKENPNYLGPAPIDDLAAQIAGAVGPSGPNPEYLFELADSLRQLGAEDPHVFSLEARVQSVLAEQATREARS